MGPDKLYALANNCCITKTVEGARGSSPAPPTLSLLVSGRQYPVPGLWAI
jgi:hypothetical protein